MKRRRKTRPRPPRSATASTVPPRTRHSTVPARQAKPPLRATGPKPPVKRARLPKRQIARVVDEEETALIDLIDNLLAKGVMLNADLILALANVDLVYVRLSALLCAADRVVARA